MMRFLSALQARTTKSKRVEMSGPFRWEEEKGKAVVPLYCTLDPEHQISASLGFVRGSLGEIE